MSDKQTFLKDKPYKFVPLIEKCVKYHSVNQGAIGKYTYSGKLKVQLEVCSLLHVGTGKVEKDKYGDSLHPFVRRNGRIIIPGSSLKGAVRSVAEAVSYSCGVRLPDYKSKLESALPQNNRKSCSDTRDYVQPAPYSEWLTVNMDIKVRFLLESWTL